MIVGYALELALGVMLSVAIVNCHHDSGSSSRLRRVVSHGYATYTDAAILLTFSIQLASLVTLIRKDFGISATDFGSLTVEVTWAAALLTMLPMNFLCYIHENVGKQGTKSMDRRDLRLVIVCISWVMFLYTFISRMIADYGPSQIGEAQPGAPPPVLSSDELSNIELLCYQGQEGLSPSENVAFQVFALGGSLFVSIAVVGAIGWAILERSDESWFRIFHGASIERSFCTGKAKSFLILFVLLWSIPQLWAIGRFRSMQQALASSIGSSDSDNRWSFGQVVAVTVFLPVLVELVFVSLMAESHQSAHSGNETEDETK